MPVWRKSLEYCRVRPDDRPKILRSRTRVPETFLDSSAKNLQFFSATGRSGYHLFDLPSYIQHRIELIGIKLISSLGQDTYQDKEQFLAIGAHAIKMNLIRPSSIGHSASLAHYRSDNPKMPHLYIFLFAFLIGGLSTCVIM